MSLNDALKTFNFNMQRFVNLKRENKHAYAKTQDNICNYFKKPGGPNLFLSNVVFCVDLRG